MASDDLNRMAGLHAGEARNGYAEFMSRHRPPGIVPASVMARFMGGRP